MFQKAQTLIPYLVVSLMACVVLASQSYYYEPLVGYTETHGRGYLSPLKLSVYPFSMGFDDEGQLFYWDTVSNTIQTIKPDGTLDYFVGSPISGVTATAGTNYMSGYLGTPQTNSVAFRFNKANRKMFIFNSNTILMADPSGDGNLEKYAGTGATLSYGSSDLATMAKSAKVQPTDLDFLPNGNVIFTDRTAGCVRKVTTDGYISSFAGRCGFAGTTMCLGTSATACDLISPQLLAVSQINGTVYIYQGSTPYLYIKRVKPDGTMDKFYGDGSSAASGLGSTLYFMRAHPVTGELYATTANDKLYIFKWDGVAVRLNKYDFPTGICTVKSFDWDKNGDLHLASSCVASFAGIVKWNVGDANYTIVAGRKTTEHSDGELAKSLVLKEVKAPAQLSSGDLVFGDATSKLLFKAHKDSGNLVTNYYGNGASLDKVSTPDFGYNISHSVAVGAPQYFATSEGSIFYTDKNDAFIARISPEGQLNVIKEEKATFLHMHSDGFLYYFAYTSCQVKKTKPDGTLTETLVGSTCGGLPSYTDDPLAAIIPNYMLSGMAVNSDNEIYLSISATIYVVNKNGHLVLFSGITGQYAYSEGTRTTAKFVAPGNMVVRNNLLYVADSDCIRAIDISDDSQPVQLVMGRGKSLTMSGTPTSLSFTPGHLALDKDKHIMVSYSTMVFKLSVCDSPNVNDHGECAPPCFGKIGKDKCGGQGTCLDVNVCTCNTGYTGEQCFDYTCFSVDSQSPNVCNNGNGTCDSYDKCSCNSNIFGQNCDIFTCNTLTGDDPAVCSGHGSCTAPENCECQPGYEGPNCEYFKCFTIDNLSPDVCSFNGNCTSPDECHCADSFYGQNCSNFNCFSTSRFDKSVCSGMGTCTSPDVCECLEGYTGNNCEHFKCGNVDKDNNSVCSSHGQCMSPDVCQCQDEYFGDNCEHFTCLGIEKELSSACSSHGSCVAPDTCSCNTGFYGFSCDAHSCGSIIFNDTTVCSSHGQCTAPNHCNCTKGYSGDSCQLFECGSIDSKDENVCGKSGKCVSPNQCECNIGYEGDLCQILQPVTSLNFTQVSYNSFVAVWTSSVVEGVTYHLKLVDSKDVSKTSTTTQTTTTFNGLSEKSMYTVSVSVEKGAVKSVELTRSMFTFSAPGEPVKVGSTIPLVIPVAVSTTIKSSSRIKVKLPTSYQVASSRRTNPSFTLTDGIVDYGLSNFEVQGNEQSAEVNQDIPVGAYYIHMQVVAQYASSDVQGLVSMIDDHHNVVELATFSAPQISAPVGQSSGPAPTPSNSNSQQPNTGNSVTPNQSNTQPKNSTGIPQESQLKVTPNHNQEEQTFYHLFFLFFLAPIIIAAIIVPIVVYIVLKKKTDVKQDVKFSSIEMQRATV